MALATVCEQQKQQQQKYDREEKVGSWFPRATQVTIESEMEQQLMKEGDREIESERERVIELAMNGEWEKTRKTCRIFIVSQLVFWRTHCLLCDIKRQGHRGPSDREDVREGLRGGESERRKMRLKARQVVAEPRQENLNFFN